MSYVLIENVGDPLMFLLDSWHLITCGTFIQWTFLERNPSKTLSRFLLSFKLFTVTRTKQESPKNESRSWTMDMENLFAVIHILPWFYNNPTKHTEKTHAGERSLSVLHMHSIKLKYIKKNSRRDWINQM